MKNSMRFFVLSLFVLCFALASGSAFSQTLATGSLEGSVTDTNGAAVPGVEVRVTSPNLISPQTTTTNDEGRFRILNLPPGRYTVTVEAAKGFGKFERTDVEINLSKTSSLDVQLALAAVGATVDVTASSGASIDTSANTTGTNVSSEQFSNFPTQRTVQSLYNIAPTVARSGLRDASGRDRDPSVAGSSGPENNYILDGVNTTDPAFGGSGANLPFEFVQEVEVKTGAYGAEYGKSTGGIFNVITKSGGNEVRGDAFGFFTTKGMVREIKHAPFTGSIPVAFSEVDAGIDVGGPIIKDKLWFFGAFNPQRRTNFLQTQTFGTAVENRITTPFYAGKLTWGINNRNTLTLSTFGDFTKQTGFLGGSGFGGNPLTFSGLRETGGHNYAARLNSTITPTWIGEFSFGLHFQRNNTTPDGALIDVPAITDNFAILRANGTIAPISQTATDFGGATGFVDFVASPGGSLQRNFVQNGFGLYGPQDRNRIEFGARMQNILGKHTIKYGFEWNRNKYNIETLSSGPSNTFADPLGLVAGSNDPTGLNIVNGFRAANSWLVCTTRGTQVVCPSAAGFNRINAAITAGQVPGFTSALNASITEAEALNNPFLVRNVTTVRDFELVADTYTNVEGFYVQEEFRVTNNLQLNFGLRWDYQQAYGAGNITYLKLNNFKDNMQPRAGFIWDFTGKGKGKVFANFARYVETPLPLDVNVRAGGGGSQTDKNFRVNRVNAPLSSTVSSVIGNLGADPTPIDPGLKPQTVNEWTAGIEYEVRPNFALGFRGIYRPQANVIEDGSFNDGESYFLFNPGRRGNGETTEDAACAGDAAAGRDPQCFGYARRYYRALEFTATKRFSGHYQFIASYVFSSLIGNYEGLFRNDNGQSDPNITSLFDLTSLLAGTYGRLPNDRPHQFKFNGSYETPWKLFISGNFYAQSGIPFNALVPHPVYGNNEGFCIAGLSCVPRGTAVVPNSTVPNGNGGLESAIGGTRTPVTYNLDLGAYYPIKFGEKRQLRFQADWFNVFNAQRAVRLDETFLINSGVAGVAPVANPFYGTGTIFQFPSSLRLGVKFQF
jgi:outer membrane receptor protein involved in Fe transport